MLLGRLLDYLVRIGTLTVIDAGGKKHVFAGSEGPVSTIRLHDRALHTKLFLRPELYFGEAYMDGTLTVEEGTLYDFLHLCTLNMSAFGRHPLHILSSRISRPLRWLNQYNPVRRARRNAAHHYDLSDTLYDLFLDRDRQYSCAYFQSDNETLEVAQDNKKRHLAAKLLMAPGLRVLDIGSGWGGLGLYLAKLADGVDVTGVTLSEEQHKVSQARAVREGLADRVRFELKDYRHVEGPFDRIVSVGMFEHVGARHYDQFFARVKALLTEDGVALLHSIGRMEPPGTTNSWLRKYIFPGGYAPALSETVAAVERVGLWVTDIEVLRLHYAQTLREWHRRFQANRDRIRDIYDERFCRMWEFYLTACEVAFRNMDQMVFQMQLTRRRDAVPLTRDYVTDWERAHTGARDLAV